MTDCDNAALVPYYTELTQTLCDEIRHMAYTHRTNYIEQVVNLISENCGYDMSLAYVAEQLGTSPSYISRIIKEKTGRNFLSLLTEMRVKRGEELLRNTEMSIKDIAQEVGYSNSYYFIKIFKEHKGMTPGEYRRLR